MSFEGIKTVLRTIHRLLLIGPLSAQLLTLVILSERLFIEQVYKGESLRLQRLFRYSCYDEVLLVTSLWLLLYSLISWKWNGPRPGCWIAYSFVAYIFVSFLMFPVQT